jgi:hypothetical protein
MKTCCIFVFLSILTFSTQAQSPVSTGPTYKSLDFLSTVKIDTVAKVLNYTDGLEDEGDYRGFWYVVDQKNCMYRKATSVFDYNKNSSNKVIEVETNSRELNLNAYDPRSLSVDSRRLTFPTGRVEDQYEVRLDGKVVFSGKDRDPKRVSKGWSLIYSKYCTGKKKEF